MIASHAVNVPLVDAVVDFLHLPIARLAYVRNSATDSTAVAIEFSTCQAFEDACRIGGAKADGGRLLAVMGSGAHRVRDANDKRGRTLEHHCWPHLDCWGGSR